MFDDIHPQNTGQCKADATQSELPVEENRFPETCTPRKRQHLT